jgi:hypothetical protein
MSLALKQEFVEVLEPLGSQSANFFLSASLYHAHKLSCSAAAHLAGLSLEDFASRLREHFDTGFWIQDEAILEDIDTVRRLTQG